MTVDESALALLIEEADWQTAIDRMAAHNYQGQLIVHKWWKNTWPRWSD
jgi:hypothetical protein